MSTEHETSALTCPYCGSDDLKPRIGISEEGAEYDLAGQYHCMDCGRHWLETSPEIKRIRALEADLKAAREDVKQLRDGYRLAKSQASSSADRAEAYRKKADDLAVRLAAAEDRVKALEPVGAIESAISKHASGYDITCGCGDVFFSMKDFKHHVDMIHDDAPPETEYDHE